MVTNARDASDQVFESKGGSFISKGSRNHRIMRDTEDMKTERGCEPQYIIEINPAKLENIWTLMPRWIELMTNESLKQLTEIKKHSALLDRVEKEIQKHHMEVNYTSIFEKIEKHSAVLDRIEKENEIQKHHMEVNYESILEKVDNLEKRILKKADLQSIQNNILYSIQPLLKPSRPSSEYAKAELSIKHQVTREHLLTYLKSISASRIISGIHVSVNSPLSSGKLDHNITGIHPGVWSISLSNFPDFILKWGSLIDEAISQWNNHSLVSLQWYPCPPTLTESCGQEDLRRQLNTTEWNDLVTDGGRLNKLWKIRLNSMIVPFLRRLESAGVVVIFAPILVMNEGFSWWKGDRDAVSGSRRLYQITHDYITKEHNLNSIIWRWSVSHNDDLPTHMEQLWPGEEYVDVASVAMSKMIEKEPSTPVYEKLKIIVGDKPMSMEWLYTVPTAELLKTQPRWTWFTVVDRYLKNPNYNNYTTVKAALENPSVINRDGIDVFTQNNYALKGTATASSFESVDVREEKAIDGKYATRWGSEFSDPQWLQIDLGQLRFVKIIKIFWETAFATGYLIQISEDKLTWTIVYEEYYGTGGLKEISINSPQMARYVKIFGFKQGNDYGYSISELEVY